MALTLTEGAKLSNDILLQGVIEETIYDSPILQVLPFIEVVGNALTYNRENALPSIDFYDVGDTWVESAPTFTQVTATLKIMGGDADVDNYIKGTNIIRGPADNTGGGINSHARREGRQGERGGRIAVSIGIVNV